MEEDTANAVHALIATLFSGLATSIGINIVTISFHINLICRWNNDSVFWSTF